jgi:hypothetical protein
MKEVIVFKAADAALVLRLAKAFGLDAVEEAGWPVSALRVSNPQGKGNLQGFVACLEVRAPEALVVFRL